MVLCMSWAAAESHRTPPPRWTSIIRVITLGGTAPPFTTARRNFPTDTNGTDHIWLSGGYASRRYYTAGFDGNLHLPAGSPTPTATATATATATVSGKCDANSNSNSNSKATLLRGRLLPLRCQGPRRRPGRYPHRRLGRKVCFSSTFLFGDSRQLASPRFLYCGSAPLLY